MQMTAVVALVLGCISITSTIITVVVFIGKTRWEVDVLKKKDDSQEGQLAELRKEMAALREKGSIPTGTLDERMKSLEKKMDLLTEKFNELFIEVKARNKTKAPRRRGND